MDENNIQIQIQRILEAKEEIRSFLNRNGANVSKEVLIDEYPEILAGLNLVDTTNTTASSDDLLVGKTAVSKGKVIHGTIPVRSGENIVPGRLSVVIGKGSYLSGDLVVQGEQMLLPWNIKKGVSLFGVEGIAELGEGGTGEEIQLGVLVEDENGELKFQSLVFNGDKGEAVGDMMDVNEKTYIYDTGLGEPDYQQEIFDTEDF